MKVILRDRAEISRFFDGPELVDPGIAKISEWRPAVQVSHLRKAYGATVAVDDVSFSVREGEIFGILGPNGAGKTTSVECVIGLRSPDAGLIRVMGLDPHVDREELHAIVGAQLQASALPGRLKVGEILEMFHSFYREASDLGEIMDSLGLAGKRDEYYRSLSGGLKQRLSIALALIGNPKIAVLDEMTTGLDPQARRDTWQLIEQARDRGVTIILVTHYMDEAERLCDRVALLDRGRIVAIDTPEGLADRAGAAKRVRFVPSKAFDDRLLTDLPEVRAVTRDGEHVIVTGSGELANAVILTLALLLALAAMFAIGLWIAAIARSVNIAILIANLLLLPMLFFAGLWYPRQMMIPVLRDIGDWTPLGASVQALQDSMRGTFPTAQSLLVLAAWAVVFGVLAVRFFRWE